MSVEDGAIGGTSRTLATRIGELRGVRVIRNVDPTDGRSRAVRHNPLNHVVAKEEVRKGAERGEATTKARDERLGP